MERRPVRWRCATRRRPLARALLCGVVSLVGCVAAEQRYSVKDLPPELLAQPWEAPCAVDLSRTAAPRQVVRVEPGDTVEVVMANGLGPSETTRITTVVGTDGTVILPQVGSVYVAGETAETAQAAVIQVGSQLGAEAPSIVRVTITQAHENRITITGAVERPGVYMLPRDASDVVSAIAAAGGLRRDADEKIVVQQRAVAEQGDEPTGTIRNADFVEKPASRPREGARREIYLSDTHVAAASQIRLDDGDVVMVERRDPPSVVVTGAVRNAGRYEFPVGQDFRVLDAVMKAGGTAWPRADTVVVCRRVPHETKNALIEVSLHRASRDLEENLRLKPDDIVSVEPRPGELTEERQADLLTIPMAVGLGMAIR